MENSEVGAVKLLMVKRVAMLLAEVWVELLRPLPFDHVLFPNGIRVRVIVDEYHNPEDTQPLRKTVEDLYPDVSTHS